MPALFPNVRVLNLNYNALTDLRPLAGMSRLVKLNCAGNRIRSVRKLQQALERCRAVKWVDFRSNPLTLGFYPPAVMTVARVGEEYAKDPFEVGEADRSEDERHVLRMDMEMRCERRRYWVLLAEACGKLKGVDGLVFERAGVEGEDEVWREMRKKGWLMIEEEGGEETAAGEEGSVISE